MVLETCSVDNHGILNCLMLQQKQERLACGTLVSGTLSKLNVKIENLPQKCQQTLRQCAELQNSTNISQLDTISISLCQSREAISKLDEEYEILLLKQRNEELQARIVRNDKFIENLKNELQNSVESLEKRDPNPDSIHECIRQMKQKVASYEESCEKSKAYITKLSVPEGVMPKSLEALISTLAALKTEAADLKQRADDITLARDARDTFLRLRR